MAAAAAQAAEKQVGGHAQHRAIPWLLGFAEMEMRSSQGAGSAWKKSNQSHHQ